MTTPQRSEAVAGSQAAGAGRTGTIPGAGWAVPGTRVPAGEVIRRVAHQIEADGVTVLAGHLAFRLMFALFPTLISVLWLLQVVNAEELVSQVSELVSTIVPGIAHDPLEQQIEGAPRSQASGHFTPGVGLSLIVAIWAIAEVFRAAMHALNVIYSVKERRSRLRRVLVSVAVSMLTMSLFVCALLLIVSGARVATTLSEWSGFGVSYGFIWWGTAWAVVIGSVLAAFSLTYYFAPDVEQRLRWVRAGSLAGVTLWLLFAGLFATYVNVFSRPNDTYGSLAGIALFMVYLYCSAFILLLGAEINQVIENWDPEGKNSGERAPSGD
jgi:membrane protein